MHVAFLKDLYGLNKKRVLKMRFLRPWKCLKTTWNSPQEPIELTKKSATETTPPLSWYSHVGTIAAHYYALVVEGV